MNKNNSEIVESFKNLLKKAEEAKGLHQGKLNNNSAKSIKLIKIDDAIREINHSNSSERLGIKSIKRIPSNPFRKKYKKENIENFKKYEFEVSNKITNILNRHIYHWVNREMPKFSRIKLRKHIYNLLSELVK
ncbi:hypothetical protein OA264_03145 [Alphaproteobacteria bacterium]|nr:hypothetical protein [Alphaproteobacteria bacterium]